MVVNSPNTFTPEPEFGYGQLFGILLRRWPWIAGALSLSVAGSVYLFSQEDPTYFSTMQLIVEPNFDQDLRAQDFDGVADDQVNETDYATQLALMRSSQFISDAVELLQDEYPDLEAEAVEEEFSLGRVETSEEATRIFEATYIDNDPIKVQRFLESLKTVYLQYNEEQQAKRLGRGLEHINNQLTKTRENLAQAQNELEQFRQSQNLLDPSLQGQDMVASLSRIQEAQRQLLAELRQVEQNNAALTKQIKLSPQNALMASRLSQSPQIQELLSGLQETSLALADRQIIYTEEDPSVQVLIEQRNNQLAQLRQEINAVVGQLSDSNQDQETASDPSLRFSPNEDQETGSDPNLGFSPNEDQETLSDPNLRFSPADFELINQLLQTTIDLQGLEARLATLKQQEAELRQEIDRYPNLIAEYDRLQPAVEIERNTLEQLLQQREQLSSELARGGFLWEVVEPPQPGQQIGPDPLKPIALGVVAGLFFGGTLAFIREAMDQRVRTSEALKRQVPLPLLGLLPVQSSRRGLLASSPTVKEDNAGLHPELADSELLRTILSPSFRESLDFIANNLQLLSSPQPVRAVAITSGLPGEGKTTLSLGLAFSLARMSQRVLVIDADLRKSGIQTGLGIAMEVGLTTLLTGKSRKCRPHRIGFGGNHIDVLPAGPSPQDAVALLSSPRFSKLIQRCKDHYDVILVDTPPILAMADALKVGAVCDGTVLVTRLDRMTQPTLTEVMALLAPIQVLGLVANGVKPTPHRYRGYGNSGRVSVPTLT